MTKNPAEIAGTRYKDEKLMSRVQKTDGTSRCFAQIENIKRRSLNMYVSEIMLCCIGVIVADLQWLKDGFVSFLLTLPQVRN